MTDRGTAKAAVDGDLRLAKSCGMTDGELTLTGRKVDAAGAAGALDLDGSCTIGSAGLGGCGLAEAVADG
jgi:hypothetical protein